MVWKILRGSDGVIRALRALVLIAGLVGMLALPHTAQAGTLMVNTLVDKNDGSCSNGDCSLREAIGVAASGDTIQFSVNGNITLNSTLVIDKSLTIQGPGASSLTLDGHGAYQVMMIGAASTETVTISGLTIANGSSGGFFGGGIRNDGSHLTLDQMLFSNNHSNGNGGGVYSGGPLTLNNSSFVANEAGSGGAIALSFNMGTISNSQFQNNRATSNDAGAIYTTNGNLTKPLTISGSTFKGNSAVRSGGAMRTDSQSPVTINTSYFFGNTADYGVGTNGYGGAVYSQSAMTIDRSVFTGNSAGSATTSNNRGGAIYSTSELTLSNSTLAGNRVRGAGGAIFFLGSSARTITNITVYGNGLIGPGSAGGIYNDMLTVTIKNSVLANNGSGGNCSGSPGFTAASTANRSSDSSCSPGFTTATLTALALKPLGNYYVPNPGSVLIDTGSNADCPALDQRGWARPVDGDGVGGVVCDIGAIETTPGYTVRQYFLPSARR